MTMKTLLALALFVPAIVSAECVSPGPCLPDRELEPTERTFDYELVCKWTDGYEVQIKTIPRGNILFPLSPKDECEAYRATRN